MRALWSALALVLALAGAGWVPAVAAQPADAPTEYESTPNPSVLLAGPVDDQQYRVGPGDEFLLYLYGPLTRNVSLVVGPEGDIFVPDLGSIPVAGMVLSEAREAILKRVREHFHGVGVQVRLSRLRTFRVYLTGDLVRTGPVSASAVSRVIDVLPDTLFLPGASRRNIEVRRRDGVRWVADLVGFSMLGDASADGWLQDGDVIHVPAAMSMGGVWGAVSDSGSRELAVHEHLGGMLRLAGGVRPEANEDSLLFVKFVSSVARESTWVSLSGILSGAFDPEVHGGDQLYVFGRSNFHEVEQATVVGRVAKAGTYPVHSGVTRLGELLTAAGGLLPDADASSLLLVRSDVRRRSDPEFDRLARLPREAMTGSEYETFRTRLAALTPEFRIDLTHEGVGSDEHDPLLMSGDVVRVEKQTNSIRVDGQVRHPGLVEFRPGASWQSYVARVGGLTNRAAHTQVRITRNASGQTLLARDVDSLAPGDFIWVPEKPDFSFWPMAKDLLIVAAQLATITVALRH